MQGPLEADALRSGAHRAQAPVRPRGGISAAQTEEMGSHKLSLVLPASLHGSFNDDQQKDLLSLAGFIAHVQGKA